MTPAIELPAADTATIAFSVTAKPERYGDSKTFYDFKIVMRRAGKIVGIEDGPRRAHATRAEGRRAGYARIRQLKTQQLFVIDVTAKDIDHGEARSCNSCAIALALWRNQERMGFDKLNFDFRVEPYGGMLAECHGIILQRPREYDAADLATGDDAMPDIVTVGRRGPWVTSMMEWAMEWDDWSDSIGVPLKELRDEHGDDYLRPYKPSPCSFVLNLSEMKPVEQ